MFPPGKKSRKIGLTTNVFPTFWLGGNRAMPPVWELFLLSFRHFNYRASSISTTMRWPLWTISWHGHHISYISSVRRVFTQSNLKFGNSISSSCIYILSRNINNFQNERLSMREAWWNRLNTWVRLGICIFEGLTVRESWPQFYPCPAEPCNPAIQL